MSQTTLTEDAPVILDSTCSTLKLWPKSATVRIDIRREVKPDVVASACALPFRLGTFDVIFCDPPHIINKKGLTKPKVGAQFASWNRRHGYHTENWINCLWRFGWWTSHKQWMEFVKATDREFRTCLKDSGTLEYKIMGGPSKRFATDTDIAEMRNFEIVKTKNTKSKNRNPVKWLTMKPKP